MPNSTVLFSNLSPVLLRKISVRCQGPDSEKSLRHATAVWMSVFAECLLEGKNTWKVLRFVSLRTHVSSSRQVQTFKAWHIWTSYMHCSFWKVFLSWCSLRATCLSSYASLPFRQMHGSPPGKFSIDFTPNILINGHQGVETGGSLHAVSRWENICGRSSALWDTAHTQSNSAGTARRILQHSFLRRSKYYINFDHSGYSILTSYLVPSQTSDHIVEFALMNSLRINHYQNVSLMAHEKATKERLLLALAIASICSKCGNTTSEPTVLYLRPWSVYSYWTGLRQEHLVIRGGSILMKIQAIPMLWKAETRLWASDWVGQALKLMSAVARASYLSF